MNKTTIIVITVVVLLLGGGTFYYFNQSKKDIVNSGTQSNSGQTNTGEPSKKDVREVVWGQLSSSTKDKINGTWKDGKTSKVTLTESMMGQVKDKSYQGKEVYIIDFPSKVSALNNIIVYADENTYVYIGDGLVE